MTDTDYTAFLASKQIKPLACGFEVDPSQIHPLLFGFQKDLVRWSLRKGRAAIFADCGLGKGLMQLEWARCTGQRTLILAPLAVAQQTVSEAKKIDLDVTYARSQAQAGDGITVTNYEMLDHFDADAFGAVVLDECFPPDTLVDTPTGVKEIRAIRIGDSVLNASGIDRVWDVHRREVSYGIRITIAGKSIISSPNHPYFTKRGWVSASHLRPGDRLLETPTAVRMVRQGIHGALCSGSQEAILRDILLSEMANEPAAVFGESPCARGCEETGRKEKAMVCVGQPESLSANRAYASTESVRATRDAREDIPYLESDAPQTFRAWGQRAWFNQATTDFTGCTWERLDSGIFFVTGSINSRLSNALQDRHCASRTENSYRGGWTLASGSPEHRREEGCQIGFARVDSLEVLELGHPDLERYRDVDGHIYFYDIGATRHPSFSVNGFLVHNSSVLKNFEGKIRTKLIETFRDTPYRLCCTATPAPNDIAELANHAEFLGIMTRVEMLATYFVHDEHGWRLKGHARKAFYKWLASWAMSLRKPSDLAYPNDGFLLPPLTIEPIYIPTDYCPPDQLFFTGLKGITDRTKVRRATLEGRVQKAADLINGEQVPWIAWVGLNEEGERLKRLVPDAVLIEGNQSVETKTELLTRFVRGDVRVMITKCAIGGFGLNLQHCARMVFVGMNDSYEQEYQAIRRCWRFGQKEPVKAYIVLGDIEDSIYQNVLSKEREAQNTAEELIQNVTEFEKAEISHGKAETFVYRTDEEHGEHWTLMLGDSAERLREIAADSIGLSVFSPPFISLYTYSATERDLGNSRTPEEFWTHFRFIIEELLRVTMPGRNCAVHVAEVPAMLVRDGYIGLKDFPGDTVRAFEANGWIFHDRITIWKNPQSQAIRTHTKGLAFPQLRKDASWMRTALADYILVFRKPGDNPSPIHADIDNDTWIEWASPVWFGIRENDTLNVAEARSNDDERHICPLQLGTIERCVRLWSNEGDTILSPFCGIGSEGFEAVRLGRKFVGIELKPEYFRVAVSNLRKAEAETQRGTLFDLIGGFDAKEK